jgi:hypothetical protein
MLGVPPATRPWLGLCVAPIAASELGTLTVRHVLVPRRVARLYAQQRELHGPIDVAITPAGVELATAHGASRLPWDHVRRWHDGPAHVVLMKTDAPAVVLPKREFDAATLERLHALLRSNVGAPAVARRG